MDLYDKIADLLSEYPLQDILQACCAAAAETDEVATEAELAAAREQWDDHGIDFDDAFVPATRDGSGLWVQGWLLVSDDDDD